MSQIQKIKNLMIIKEVQNQKPVTEPINVEALIMVLQQIYKIKPEYLDGITQESDIDFLGHSRPFSDLIEKNGRLFGLPRELPIEVFDFISAFILLNIDNLISGVSDKLQYTIPKLKTFFIEGSENYSKSVMDHYEMKYDSYTIGFLESLFRTGELQIYDYGHLVSEDDIDVWDSEQIIDNITEVIDKDEKVNEVAEMNKFKTSFTTEEFIKYVNSEFDVEMLKLMEGMVTSRINTLDLLTEVGNHKSIKGL